jgi:hypothetical protein
MKEDPRDPQARYVPPPPSERSVAWVRLVFIILALGALAGVWAITGALSLPWRIALAVLVAAPFLLMPDLLRDRTAAPPGFKPRKWEDDDDET